MRASVTATGQATACPRCNGPAKKGGFRGGKQQIRCKARCQRRAPSTTSAQCKHCKGRVRKAGVIRGKQTFRCVASCKRDNCKRKSNYQSLDRPHCITCRRPMTPESKTYGGSKAFGCRVCSTFLLAEPRKSKAYQMQIAMHVTPKQRRERQQAARSLGDRLLEICRNAVPSSMPSTLQEDFAQELALGALAGDYDIRSLKGAISLCRQKVNSLEAKPFNHIFIDHPISGTTLSRWDIAG